jgi:hypothetical protein
MKAATNATEGIAIAQNSAIPIQEVRVSAYTIPTEQPESDGTIEWNSTTMVLVEVQAGGKTGIGYSYADATAGTLVESLLAGVVKGGNAFDPRWTTLCGI